MEMSEGGDYKISNLPQVLADPLRDDSGWNSLRQRAGRIETVKI
jgi:hypothetical protein